MYIKQDISLKDFAFWGGALDRASLFTDEEFNILEEYLEECCGDMTETEVNDFIWFDDEFYIVDLFDYNDTEEFYEERGNR